MLIEQWCHVGTAPCCNFFSDKKWTHPPRVLIKINYPANPNTAWRLRIYRGVIANSIVLYTRRLKQSVAGSETTVRRCRNKRAADRFQGINTSLIYID